ncbi:MAG: hypothetical protein HOI03_07980, partial [Candidatus Marinimicrobia bacterium]|nr:hypothetical protein [Candidatus Neomarinimicrobiota bacterium]
KADSTENVPKTQEDETSLKVPQNKLEVNQTEPDTLKLENRKTSTPAIKTEDLPSSDSNQSEENTEKPSNEND